MPRTLTSKIILAKNIKMDKSYNNVIDYTEQQMLSLLRNQNNLVREQLGYSFIREQNKIQTNISYNECLQSNYLAFQNPDYSNKWFFAFIDEIKFIGENNTEITYTIDVWSTFFKSLTIKPCFVVREHVNDDTIGLHTVPESVELGDYINNMVTYCDDLDECVYVVQATETLQHISDSSQPNVIATNFGGVPMTGCAYICKNMSELATILNTYNSYSKLDEVYSVYVIPLALLDWDDSQPMQFAGQSSPKVINFECDKPISINSYYPKNNKLFTYPYSCLEVTNNAGISNILKYEFFSGNKATFKIKGVPTCGGSIKCIPFTYNTYIENEEEGIIGAKFPTLNWSEDNYLNWQMQEGVNLQAGIQAGILQTALGIGGTALGLPAGASLTGQGIGNIGGSLLNHLSQKQIAQMMPTTAKGNTNGGNINFCSHKNGFIFINKTIKREFAKIIDDYFSRMGYQINETKIPNITGRSAFNYIKIANSECIGYGSVQSKYLDIINNICRNGVTIWHNHDNVGNYSINNSII